MRKFAELTDNQPGRSKVEAHPELLWLAIAVPPRSIPQDEVRELAAPYLEREGLKRLIPVFDHVGIETRSMAKPVEWYMADHDWVERSAAFEETAYALLEQATVDCLDQAGVKPGDVDGVVLVTSTGVTIPTLDVKLANRLGFPTNIERTPIFGLGCAGGVTGLARASQLSRSRASANILMLAVEICSINLSLKSITKLEAVSTALFADGASACLMRFNEAGDGSENPIGRYLASGEYCWPNTEHLAGINIRNDSFGLVLSPELVPFVRDHLAKATDGFLKRHGYSRKDFDGFLFHAGASKIVESVAESLELDPEYFECSNEVLRAYGNLSACSALFVLDHAVKNGASGLHLMAALGPGFTVSFLIIDLGGQA